MKNKNYALIGLVVLLTSLSCSLLSAAPANKTHVDAPTQAPAQAATPASQATEIPQLAAEGSGPQGFSASATSPNSVMLTWQAVTGAESYQVMMSTIDGTIFDVIDLPSSVTNYEDFLAPPDTQITYGVRATGKAGPIGQSLASVKSQASKPNPLQVTAEFEDSEASKMVIGPAGGSIALTARGVTYELSIPVGALEEDTEITLTPVKDLADWPLDGAMIGAIRIQPEGLWLNAPASLKMTPASGIADTKLARTGFTFDGFGSEFSLATLAPANTTVAAHPTGGGHTASLLPVLGPFDSLALWLPQLGPAGAGEVSPELAGKIARENAPTDGGRNQEQKVTAAAIEEEELAPLLSNLELKIIRMFKDSQREIAQADNCSKLTTAVFNFDVNMGVSDMLEKKANVARNQALKEAIWKDLIKRTKDIIDHASQSCENQNKNDDLIPNQRSCAERVLKAMEAGLVPFFKEFQKRMIDQYGPDGLAKAREKFDQSCVTGYVMRGGGGGMEVPYAYVCLNQTFTAHGSLAGGSILLTFVPGPAESPSEIPAGGSYSYNGSGGGFQLAGDGTFTLMGKLDGPIRLEAFGPGTVASYGGSGSESYILTPKGHGCSKP